MRTQLHILKKKKISTRHLLGFLGATCLFATVAFASNVVARNMDITKIGNDEETFTFTGKCPNGAAYRVVSYQMESEGTRQSFYDYQGPAGKGTVRTNVSPQKMVVRLCHELADISDGSKYD